MWDRNDDPRSVTFNLDDCYHGSYRLSSRFLIDVEADVSRITSLPQFPADATDIDVVGCKFLRKLPALPLNILSLNCNRCSSLRTLPRLPPTLQTLSSYACHQLRRLPPLPDSLVILNCSDCPELLELPPLPLSPRTRPMIVLCGPRLRLPDDYPLYGVRLNFEDSEASAVQWAARVRARHAADRSMLAHLPLAALLFV